MPAPDAVAEVARRWLRSAATDLETARRCLGDRTGIDPWVAAFHAQQAAEKLLKAALVIEQIPFSRTHELERLASKLPSGWTSVDTTGFASLTRFAASGRYPDDPSLAGADSSWVEAEDAVRIADDLAATIAAGAGKRGVRA